MSYGAGLRGFIPERRQFRRQILRGAKPADIPSSKPIEFDLVHQSKDREGAWTDRAANSALWLRTR